MKLWAHWMKKMMRRAKNKRRKGGLATRAHLLMRVTLQLIHCLISLRALPKDDCYDDCDDPIDSFEISLVDELDACYAYGQDANMNYAYGDELAIVTYVKHEIVAIAPTHDSPIIFLTPDYTISEKFALIKDYIDGLLLPLHMMILIDIICMCLLLLLAIIMREELHLRLSMFPTR